MHARKSFDIFCLHSTIHTLNPKMQAGQRDLSLTPGWWLKREEGMIDFNAVETALLQIYNRRDVNTDAENVYARGSSFQSGFLAAPRIELPGKSLTGAPGSGFLILVMWIVLNV